MNNTTQITLFPNSWAKNSDKTIGIDMLLGNIRDGLWEDLVHPIRSAKSKEDKSKHKKKVPCVTISGEFSGRKDADIVNHSGFICIDIDDIDPLETKAILCADEYVYSAFTSIGGYGLAVLFKINPAKHKEAFDGLSEYLFEKYKLVVDGSARNVGRLRFISFDPDIYINEKSKKFAIYPSKKHTTRPQNNTFVYVKDEFTRILQNICDNGADIAGNYQQWRNIGFAFADHFGEDGRSYFLDLSRYRYGDQAANDKLVDRQYSACMKAKGSGVTMASFYFLAKQAGISIQSEQVREITYLIKRKKAKKVSTEDIIDNLLRIGGYDEALVHEILPQVNERTVIEDLSLVEEVENEIRDTYKVRRNVIKRTIELEKDDKWIEMEVKHENSLILAMQKKYSKAPDQLIKKILDSEQTPDFNPIIAFIDANREVKSTGHIKALSDTISSSLGLLGSEREHFITKWLVNMIASIYNHHNPLMLILVGSNQGTGKTEFFRRLLPKELKAHYYAESNLDVNSGDLATLLSENILVVNDELGGNTAKDLERMKALLSKQETRVRIAYGKKNQKFVRLASLAGTSNNDAILNDPTGNRRLIPIHVAAIDHAIYNAIDKTGLFMECVALYDSGFDYRLTKQDVIMLTSFSDNFKAVIAEEELIFKYYKTAKTSNLGKWVTSSDIKSRIEILTRQRLSTKIIGMVMSEAGIERRNFDSNGRRQKGYFLEEVNETL